MCRTAVRRSRKRNCRVATAWRSADHVSRAQPHNAPSPLRITWPGLSRFAATHRPLLTCRPVHGHRQRAQGARHALAKFKPPQFFAPVRPT